MRRPGQPLRFLGWVVSGWIAIRIAILLTVAFPFVSVLTKHGGRAALTLDAPAQPTAARPFVAAYGPTVSVAIPPAANRIGGATPSAWVAVERPAHGTGMMGAGVDLRASPSRSPQRVQDGISDPAPARTAWTPVSADALSRRWSATAWMLWRPDVAGGLAQAPLLGGSQAGARIDYRVAEGRLGRFGLYGRISRALTGAPAEEAALGVAFRPGRAPVSVLAERRQRLGRGGRSGFALLAAGGLNPREVAPRLMAEGYAQGGMVGLPGLDGFADGKASLGYRLTPGRARSRLTLGASLSGGVQPGAGRLDVGPELSLRLPAGPAALRLSVEWRERVLGDARPARGPAVTLVSDF